MQFFERQQTISRTFSKQADTFYQTSSGGGSAFTTFDRFDSGFDSSMRETKMSFFFQPENETPVKNRKFAMQTANNFFRVGEDFLNEHSHQIDFDMRRDPDS